MGGRSRGAALLASGAGLDAVSGAQGEAAAAAAAGGGDLLGGGQLPGLRIDAVTPWLADHVGLSPPLRFQRISGGRSNLTFKVADVEGRTRALRRPPVSGVLPSAHDMGREYRVCRALRGTAVPAPEALAFCDDPKVTGAPFWVMDFIEGQVVRDELTASRLFDPSQRRALGLAVVDTLADIHAVDLDAVGLRDLGRGEDYVGRQLRRWHRQWEQFRIRPLPILQETHDVLVDAAPPPGEITLVHGDYRLANVLVSLTGEIRAVLDWELCTLGDPLADLGLTLAYWNEPDDELQPLGSAPTSALGFPSRRDVLARYAKRTGRDVSKAAFYLALGYWKLAVVLEGVHTRERSGAYGDQRHTDEDPFPPVTEDLATAALRVCADPQLL
ncbi:MAG: phosphotransferase [Nitriliruptorales bacterium]|nr:phosphotransferase [Nitriliruptorales bacterium]